MLHKKLLIGIAPLLAVAAFAVVPAVASAAPRIFNKKGGALLRDVKMAPALQPDAGEFVNNGPVVLETGVGPITCTEEEFGTTVVTNAEVELKLGLPFGVAENDECKNATVGEVHTYFDTNEQGAVGEGATTVASVTVTGAAEPFTATFHNLKFSQHIVANGNWCTGTVSNKTAKVTNGTEPFVEQDGTPEPAKALKVKFEKAKIPVAASPGQTCALAGTEAELSGEFYLETPSTETEGAFIG